MKLIKFIKELEKISKKVKNPKIIDVQMADCVSVSCTNFKKKTVFITDIKNKN